MTFLPADWVICAIAAVAAITGLFRGFSGTLAFFIAVAVAALMASFGWGYSLNFTAVTWMRGGIVLVATLLIFGIVRLLVKKLVNGLLSQPSDAIFGFLVGALFGAILLAGWAYSGMYLEYSNLAREVSGYVR